MNTIYSRARKDRPAGPAPAVASGSIPKAVAETLSHLAHLIDESIALRGEELTMREFAARQLGLAPHDVAYESRSLNGIEAPLVGLALADAIERFEPSVIVGGEVDDAPQWRALSRAASSRRYPTNLHAVFPAGTFTEHALMIGVVSNWTGVELVVYGAGRHASVARQAVEDIVEVSRGLTNPFRGRIVGVSAADGPGVALTLISAGASSRADLVLPDEVWDAVDLNVGGMFAALETFEEAGMSTNRGVLLYGPPGTGKTAIIRALATELSGEVTVLVAGSSVLDRVQEMYEMAGSLSPAIVVLEDLERVITGRGHGGRDLLNVLDGVARIHGGVVTIATANEPREFDPALLRSARFDAKIEVPLPSVTGREEILRRYLEQAGLDLDPRPIAVAARAASGADLRELVHAAVLVRERDGHVTSLALAEEARRRFATPPAGQYL